MLSLRTVHLGLQGNDFQGEIPDEWEGMKKLEILDLADCKKIRGPVPAALEGMRALKYLSLHNTSVEGQIPAFLGGLTKLSKWLSTAWICLLFLPCTV